MPTITDLTGTTWLLPQIIDTYNLQDKLESLSLNFISYKDSFIIFDMYFGGADMSDNLYYDSIRVYYNGWTNEAYRTIKITGGTDATNSDLIEWLQTHATQIIDLSNTHWKLNNNLTFTNVGTKNINFKSGNTNFSSITISGSDGLKYNNTTIVEAPTAIIINFTIKSIEGVGTTYQAEEGMTWQEWVDSEYNTDGWFIQSNYVTNGVAIIRVATTDTIISGGLYSSAGGGFD